MFKHLQEKNMTYFEHMIGAFYFSLLSLHASVVFFIHGLMPDIFTETGSSIIKNLNTYFPHQK